MNDGAYWRALERFAGEVCIRANVDCISYATMWRGRKRRRPFRPVAERRGLSREALPADGRILQR